MADTTTSVSSSPETFVGRIRALLGREFSIAGGSVVLMAAFVVSAVLGIVRQMLFNAHFGAGAEASAYYAAFRLPDTLASLIAGGTIASALTPLLLSAAYEEGEAAAQRLLSLVMTTLLAVVLPLVAFCMLATPWFVRNVLVPGFDPATSALSADLTRLLLCELLSLVVYSTLSTLLLSRSQFLLPAIATAVHNVVLISGILAAMAVPSIGIYGPTVGALGDSLLQILILVPGLRRHRYRYRFVWAPRDRRLYMVIMLMIPTGLSGVVGYFGGTVSTAYASLAGTMAALPALENASMLVGLPQRLLGIAVAQATFPRLAALAVAGEWWAMRRLLLRVLLICSLLALLAVGAMVGLGRVMIQVLFERGRFDAEAGALTYRLLVIYTAGIPAFIAGELFIKALASLLDTRTPLFTNVAQALGRAALVALLFGSLGLLAIPLAFVLTSILEVVVLGIVLFIRLNRRIILTRNS